jgi:transposase
MTNIVKQTVGIDVAQNELVVSLGRMSHDTGTDIFAFKTFANNTKGFNELVNWVNKLVLKELQVRYVMEATGVYHENLAYYLSDHGQRVSIVLPNKISNYFRTLDVKTITDKTASQAICRFGLERKLDEWQKPKQIYRTLKQLTRERDQLIAERTVAKNQLHAEKAEAFPNEKSIARLNKRIELFKSQVKEIQADINEVLKKDNELTELIRSKKQLVSYSGLDVKEKTSGTSVKGKPRISKKGNRHLRKSMYFPALTAIRHDEHFKAVFVRLVSKHGLKMKSAVAVQRKILELIYILWNTNTKYDKEYLERRNAKAA